MGLRLGERDVGAGVTRCVGDGDVGPFTGAFVGNNVGDDVVTVTGGRVGGGTVGERDGGAAMGARVGPLVVGVVTGAGVHSTRGEMSHCIPYNRHAGAVTHEAVVPGRMLLFMMLM